MTDLTFNLDKNFIEDQPKNPENIQAFDYKLIGYRYGESDSSVVVKKGNKEFVEYFFKNHKLDKFRYHARSFLAL